MDVITFGSAVKALGEGKVGGHLILYGDETTPDLSAYKDYFTKSTEYDIEAGDKRGMYWAHGQDPKIGVKKIGTLTVTPDDHGLWVEGVLNMADEYQRSIYALAEKGKLGWSSGAPSHLVTRKAVETKGGGTVHEILTWPIAEGSLTPTPADYRNVSYTIKSLADALVRIDEELTSEETIAETASTEADADETETPQVKEINTESAPATLPYGEHLDAALAAIDGVIERGFDINDLRIKSGRVLSAANRSKLKDMHTQMQTAHAAMASHIGKMGDLLAETDPQAKKDAEEVGELRMQFLRLQSRALGVAV